MLMYVYKTSMFVRMKKYIRDRILKYTIHLNKISDK